MVTYLVVLIVTHVWLWWLTEPARLPAKAMRHIAAGVRDYEVSLSAMSSWEIARLVATAQSLGAILITKDETMRRYKCVGSVWD